MHKTHLFEKKCMFVSPETRPVASLKRRNWNLGISIHMKILFMLMDIHFIPISTHLYTLLVLDTAVILPMLLSLLGDCLLPSGLCYGAAQSLEPAKVLAGRPVGGGGPKLVVDGLAVNK